MLARLRAKLAASGFSNVDVVEAGFLSYQHSGRPADFVYSRWALHHLPDFWKSVALHRIRKVLLPGGVLRLSDLVYSFDPGQAEERIEEWCAALPVQATGDSEWSRPDIEEHVRDEHSTSPSAPGLREPRPFPPLRRPGRPATLAPEAPPGHGRPPRQPPPAPGRSRPERP